MKRPADDIRGLDSRSRARSLISRNHGGRMKAWIKRETAAGSGSVECNDGDNVRLLDDWARLVGEQDRTTNNNACVGTGTDIGVSDKWVLFHVLNSLVMII